jgi:predicted aldo/keto reductase-like oxidoreductase
MNVSLRQLFAAALAAPATAGGMTVRTARHGEKVGLLGYGCMRLPTVDGGHANPWGEKSSKTAIDQAMVNAHVDYALAHGVNYFDTSPAYCRGESERVIGTALKRHPRERYFIATKMSNFAASQYSAKASMALFEKSLRELQTDYIDFYLLHSVGNGGMKTFRKRYVDNGMIPWLVEQKRRGRIRNLGWSYHGDPATVDWLLERHDKGDYTWDFVQIQLNYVDWRHAQEVNKRNLNADYLYRELARRDIPVVVMEPLLGGRLARHNDALAGELTPLDPEATLASWALRFCGTFPKVLTVLSGMTFKEHLEENIATFSPLKPLGRRELLALERAATAYLGSGAIPCNLCDYCMPCPYGIDIPGILTFMNRVRSERLTEPREIRRAYAQAVPDPRRRADRCISCRRCVPHCPQQIDIPKVLDGIAAFVEDFS